MISTAIHVLIATWLIWTYRHDDGILIAALVMIGVEMLTFVAGAMYHKSNGPPAQGFGQAPPFRPERPPPKRPDLGE